jgi:hypothetical protein
VDTANGVRFDAGELGARRTGKGEENDRTQNGCPELLYHRAFTPHAEKEF